jgi:DMSO/TMAO reductase YedYZ heme-binding membrane subunit
MTGKKTMLPRRLGSVVAFSWTLLHALDYRMEDKPYWRNRNIKGEEHQTSTTTAPIKGAARLDSS